MNNQALATRIRDVRVSKGKTQEEFADVLGISRQAYVRIEQGKRSISFLEINTLSEYIGEHYKVFTEIDDNKDLSLLALCRNKNFSADQQLAFETVNEILSVFSAQERLYYRVKEDD
ncbi:helix-turn-helix domain-containing protein [Bacillus thuringiensis]|nr:helix-turn-helix domain-containing protein [Bacillus thuringiensis]